MAFNVKNINPLDRQPRKAIGVDLPFSGDGVFNSTFQTKDALKVNLINYLLTNKGERPLNPSFGAGIRENITENIKSFFPTIIPTKVEVFSDPDTNLISFFLRYAIANQNIEDEILINIE